MRQTLAPGLFNGYNMRMKTIMRTQLMQVLTRELTSLGLLHGGKTLLAGVSGGADSVALLHGMALMRESHDFSLTAVHVEHGLRGEASLNDAAFVKALCRSLHVPLLAYPVDALAFMETLRCGQEEAARILRYGCFAKAMKECGGDAILLAHHGDDQAETVLMHLMRGSGPAGLCGMAASVPFAGGLLVRPILSLRHEALVQALEEEGLPWREDETNFMPDSLRNKLRLAVMPVLNSLSPGCTEAMGRTAFLMAAEADWWRDEAGKWLQANARMEPDLCFLQRGALEKQHPAYQRRILRAFWEQAVFVMALARDRGMTALDFDKTEELLASIAGRGGRAVNLPGGVRGERSAKRLFLIPPRKYAPPVEAPLSLKGETHFEGFIFHAGPWQPGMMMGDGIRRQALDKRMLEGAVLRTRRPGDTFRLLNDEGRKTLKETLIDHHVDRPFRDMLPLLAKGNEVLWIPGVGPSGAAAIRPETEGGVLMNVEGPFPWETAKDVNASNKESLV